MDNIFDKYVGQIFDRRYKIKKIIGMGGMAVVFEAYDMLKNRPVAVKMLKDDISGDTQAIKRFINESKAVAMLSHPNIVNIYDVSVKENLKYIVMELIDGITLKTYMQKKGALSFKEVVSMSEQILRALEHAHSKGIVHRDIKPQNIMLLKDGTIKVADFGIAKLPNAETVTMTDKAIGTVYYISPEQASGKPIDHRSDLYSLGATMYEMATGKLPFTADSPVSVALMQVKSTPKNPREYNPNIPRGLEQIILISMEKNPAHRFQSATQMLRHLLQIKNNPKAVFKVSAKSTENENLISHTSNVQQKTTRSRRSGSMFPIIMGITGSFLIVAVVSAISILTTLAKATSSENERSVKIPDFVDQVYDEENFKEVWNNDFNFTIVDEIHDDAKAGTIIKQTPEDGDIKQLVGDAKYTIELTLSLGAEEKIIEDYRYLDYRGAKIELERLKFTTAIEQEYHDYIPTGHIIETIPGAGEIAKHGDRIVLKVSKGQNLTEFNTTVPNFVGLTEKEAKLKLEETGLKLGNFKYVSSDYPKGTITLQSIPDEVEVPEGTKIDFEISRGPEKITLENYAGVDYRNAKLALENLKLKPEIILEFSDTVPSDRVISTSPNAGASLEHASKVILVVSKGKDPSTELITMPDFIGKNQVAALEKLDELKLVLGNLEFIPAPSEKGTVVYQSIDAGTMVAPESVVNIKVSIGPDEE